MTLYRITADIFFELTDKTTVNDLWSVIKNKLAKFKDTNGFTLEGSKIQIHICGHDQDPPIPCIVKKEIIMNTITQDDDL